MTSLFISHNIPFLSILTLVLIESKNHKLLSFIFSASLSHNLSLTVILCLSYPCSDTRNILHYLFSSTLPLTLTLNALSLHLSRLPLTSIASLCLRHRITVHHIYFHLHEYLYTISATLSLSLCEMFYLSIFIFLSVYRSVYLCHCLSLSSPDTNALSLCLQFSGTHTYHIFSLVCSIAYFHT